ncbi:hypothetical protein ACVGWG_01580, partial [Enterobacter asburiae]
PPPPPPPHFFYNKTPKTRWGCFFGGFLYFYKIIIFYRFRVFFFVFFLKFFFVGGLGVGGGFLFFVSFCGFLGFPKNLRGFTPSPGGRGPG